MYKRKENGAFIVDYSENARYSCAFSNMINGVPKIYIPYRNTIDLSYTITHEFMHDTTIMGADESITRNIFCELFSLYGERLQDMYLNQLGDTDATLHARENVEIIQNKALCMSFEFALLQLFLEQGYIKNNEICSILKSFHYNYNVWRHYKHILCTQKLYCLQDQRHVIGSVFASYMWDCEDRHPTNHKAFFDLNEMMNTYSINNFLNYLGLFIDDNPYGFDLDKESYQKLGNSYVRQLKKIR